MVEINLLTESDRASWELLARGKDVYFAVERSDDDYERTWRRLLDDERIRGIAARLDGEMVAIAHYRGVATAVIEWVAQDATAHGFPGLYWNTLEDAPARALYDNVGKFQQGLIHYTYRPAANGRRVNTR
ncbi:GNAT family N-acetyltransferase [Nocardia sp. NPDC006044]|uniref:GNAT family N-acetyltransferase n=1 Tax=Nocardia sp. NPDC006044 TaxID=3364306 RepID=UPI0036CD41DC